MRTLTHTVDHLPAGALGALAAVLLFAIGLAV